MPDGGAAIVAMSKGALLKELDADQQQVLRIHRQHVNSHATDRCPADDTRAIKFEMLRPNAVRE
jgi:hypothetical protein